ncbi:MAG: DHH family phosphoesterase [Oscillibacter sp.]|nr:DHH family phosphoesterase [Oscillibacter sp.]
MLSVKETAALLRSFDNILILTHVRPDGDTVGCAAALCAALRALGKTAYLLPNPGLTDTTAPYAAPYSAPEGFVPEKVISTDIATLGLLPENARPYAGRIDLAIDHHTSFEHFAKENIVRPEAGACGELMYDILTELGVMDREMALLLYLAISTDTGCFAYGNTTARTHAVTAALMETGIDVYPLNKVFFGTKTRRRMALEADMLVNAQYFDENRCVFLYVPMALMERIGATETDAEDLSSLGRQIEGVDCAVTFRELRPNVWKLSVRTDKRVNATKVCARMGGGGHPAAAGCTVEAPLAQVKETVLAALRAEVEDFAEE